MKTNVAPVQSLWYSDEVDTDEELGPLPRTRDNTSAVATTVTTKTLYVEGETSVQTGLQTKVVTVTKRGKGRGAPIPIVRKEPRNSQRGRG